MQKYHFLYDNFGNTTSIGIGGWNSTEQLTLASYEYAAMNGLLTKQTYGNGDKVEFTYDILGRAKTTTYKDENGNTDRKLTYVYTGDGQLYSIHDSRTGFLYLYTYDSIGRLIGSSVKNSSGEVLMSTRQEYNANNQLTGQHWTVGNTTYSETYTYSKVDGALATMKTGSGHTLYMEYDSLRRLSSVSGFVTKKVYTYRDISATQTTSQVSELSYPSLQVPLTFSYVYDELGNITQTSDLISGTKTYTYDPQGQMLTESIDGAVTSYTYDSAGNILTANDGNTVHTYTYGNTLWRDQLTAYDGEAIVYDASGNPTSYYNGARYAFTWQEGRNLVSATAGTNTYTYAYDSNGLRISKTENGKTHTYLYASGKLLREAIYDANGNLTTIMDFVYDQNGQPYALKYNGTFYFYVLNLQGDVVRIVDGGGTSYGVYRYDAWGNILYATNNDLINANPLRYRGCYYDAETGFYYLHFRYYDPQIASFLNHDTVFDYDAGLQGYNLFVYCGNNPINRIDISGADSNQLEENVEVVELDDSATKGALPSGGPPSNGISNGNSLQHGGSSVSSAKGGGSPQNGAGSGNNNVPQHALDTLKYIDSHNGSPPKGYKGGRTYDNDGRDNSEVLPAYEGPFREYDVHPKAYGVDRGDERIVIGINGSAWYTSDHYKSFTRIR